MVHTTSRDTPRFTHTLSGLVALGEIFGLDPTTEAADQPLSGLEPEPGATSSGVLGAACFTSDTSAPPADPPSRLAALKALRQTLARRRERDREAQVAAFSELATYDALLAELQAQERTVTELQACRTELAEALAKPFGDPDWLYDPGLRQDYVSAIAEADETATALAQLIAEKQHAAKEAARQPVVARLLDERRRHKEALRAQENAAETKRQRSQALASAISLRDAGKFQEAIQALGPVTSRFPDDLEVHSLRESIDRAERAVKEAQALATLAEARRQHRRDPDGAAALVATIDTASLSADRMHEVAGVAAAIARRRNLANPHFLRSRTPNSLAIIAEARGQWTVAVAAGQDPALRVGCVVGAALAATARPLHHRHERQASTSGT
jgi:hypothetical protein